MLNYKNLWNNVKSYTNSIVSKKTIPESGFLEPELTFEDVVCLYLKQMASNINDDSLYNQQFGNLPKLIEIIEWYETNEIAMKANLVKNMILIILYLINIIERINKKAFNANK